MQVLEPTNPVSKVNRRPTIEGNLMNYKGLLPEFTPQAPLWLHRVLLVATISGAILLSGCATGPGFSSGLAQGMTATMLASSGMRNDYGNEPGTGYGTADDNLNPYQEYYNASYEAHREEVLNNFREGEVDFNEAYSDGSLDSLSTDD
jgi:hypothetical protein